MTASTPMQILGVEVALLGSFAALAFSGVEPHVTFRVYLIATVVSFVLGPGMRGPIWGSIGRAASAPLPSFFTLQRPALLEGAGAGGGELGTIGPGMRPPSASSPASSIRRVCGIV